jgi:hypothetical protein
MMILNSIFVGVVSLLFGAWAFVGVIAGQILFYLAIKPLFFS